MRRSNLRQMRSVLRSGSPARCGNAKRSLWLQLLSTLPLNLAFAYDIPTIDTRNAGSLGVAALLIAASCWFQAGAAVAGAWIDTAPAGQRGVHR